MAVTNLTTGEYVKIHRVDTNQNFIEVYRFRDADQRADWGADGLSRYERFDANIYEAQIDLSAAVEPDVTLRDNIYRKAYAALKQLPEFLDWQDC